MDDNEAIDEGNDTAANDSNLQLTHDISDHEISLVLTGLVVASGTKEVVCCAENISAADILSLVTFSHCTHGKAMWVKADAVGIMAIAGRSGSLIT